MILRQTLRDLCFLHWPVEPESLDIPAELELDTFEGQAWRTLVALRLDSIHQLNTRTYVKPDAVYFLRLDGNRRLAALGARWFFHLPYHHAPVEVGPRGFACGEMRATYEPTGEPFRAEPGTLDHWLTERYANLLVRGGRVRRGVIEHEPWPLQRVTVECADPPALAHYVAGMTARVYSTK